MQIVGRKLYKHPQFAISKSVNDQFGSTYLPTAAGMINQSNSDIFFALRDVLYVAGRK